MVMHHYAQCASKITSAFVLSWWHRHRRQIVPLQSLGFNAEWPPHTDWIGTAAAVRPSPLSTNKCFLATLTKDWLKPSTLITIFSLSQPAFPLVLKELMAAFSSVGYVVQLILNHQDRDKVDHLNWLQRINEKGNNSPWHKPNGTAPCYTMVEYAFNT